MNNKFEHLPFNRIEGSLPRRSHGGGGGGEKRTDRRSQGIQIISQIGEIKKRLSRLYGDKCCLFE